MKSYSGMMVLFGLLGRPNIQYADQVENLTTNCWAFGSDVAIHLPIKATCSFMSISQDFSIKLNNLLGK